VNEKNRRPDFKAQFIKRFFDIQEPSPGAGFLKDAGVREKTVMDLTMWVNMVAPAPKIKR